MKYSIKKVHLILILTTFLFCNSIAFSKDITDKYSQKSISSYLSGIISANQDYTADAFEHLNQVQSLKNIHHNFNIEFIHTLILLQKFKKAFNFSQDLWKEDDFFYEVDLLLGLESFINKDYTKAKKHFRRLNKTIKYNLPIEDFLGNALISWTHASENNKESSYNFTNKIPNRYENLKKIQKSFLNCHFNSPGTKDAFNKLIEDEEYSFSRYNFFLANYLLSINDKKEAKKVILEARSKDNSNLLIQQTEDFILSNNLKKIKKIFDCKNPKDVIAEIFYIVANLYSSQKDYKLSNFYLQISLFLNSKFAPNKTLLAENFFYLKKYDLSKKTYNSLKSIGPVYSWYSSKNMDLILSYDSNNNEENFYPSILEKEFKSLSNPNFIHYYELANFYKDYEHYEESIKYYSIALEKLKEDHFLVPKILDRRGTSYERMGDWKNAEKDLLKSLEMIPDQPHVLNYLAYSWIEKRKNIDKALKMLQKANQLRENDGYIIDSLGWAHYVSENYEDAEKFLQRAVELMPLDPVINDHFGDTLWMLNKNIQARYLWKYVLNLDETEQQLKEKVKKKLIFGITKNL